MGVQRSTILLLLLYGPQYHKKLDLYKLFFLSRSDCSLFFTLIVVIVRWNGGLRNMISIHWKVLNSIPWWLETMRLWKRQQKMTSLTFDPESVVECFSDMSSSPVEDSGWCSHREWGWCRCCSAPGDYTPCRSPSEILE